ncbi:MAG: hypothetical protein ACRD5H_08710, partial [Nitrososphaerales archaeon]
FHRSALVASQNGTADCEALVRQSGTYLVESNPQDIAATASATLAPTVQAKIFSLDSTGYTLDFDTAVANYVLGVWSFAGEPASDSKVSMFEGGTQVGSVARRLDFDASDFNVTEDSVNDQFDVALNYGTAAGTVCEGNDARLSDTRTPTDNTVSTVKVQDDAITNAKLANMATSTFKGRTAAGTGDPQDLTSAQATALLDTFTPTLKGLAPASGGGTTTFLRADGSWASPPGGTTGFYNAEDQTGLTDVDKINNAFANTARRKVTLLSGKTYSCTKMISMLQDGQILDGQGGTLQVTATYPVGDEEMITIGGATDGNSVIGHEVGNLKIDFNNNASHPRGIGTYDATGSSNPIDAITKFVRIHDILFVNHTHQGFSPLYLRNMENLCHIYNIKILTLGNNTIGIHVIDQSTTSSSANHGNIDLDHCRVSLTPGGVGYKFESTGGDVQNDPLNRVKVTECQAFVQNKADNDGTIGYFLAPGDTGGAQNCRHWFFDHVTAEDCFVSFKMERTQTASGVWNFEISGFGFEDKQNATFTTPRTAILINSAGFNGVIHDGGIMCQVPDSTSTSNGIDLSNIGSADVITIHHVTFFKKSGAGTFNPFVGLSGKDGVIIHSCPGYNPVGEITNAWDST